MRVRNQAAATAFCAALTVAGSSMVGCPESDTKGPVTQVGPTGTGAAATTGTPGGATDGTPGAPPPASPGAPTGDTAISKLAPDGVVAVVDGTPVTRSDIDRAIVNRAVQVGAPPQVALGPMRSVFEWAALDYAVQRIALKNAAKAKGMVADEATMNKSLETFKKRLPEGKTIQDFLTASQNDQATFEEDMRTDIMIDTMFKGIAKDTPSVDPAAVRKHFDANQDIYAQDKKATVHQMVFKVRPDATPEEIAQAKAKADAAVKSVRGKGAKAFEKVAKAQSDDPRTKDKGGAMGEVTPMQLLPAISDVAFGLKKGAVSEPIRSEFGFHVVRSGGIKKQKPRTFKEMKDRITMTLNAEAKQRAVAVFVQKTKEAAKVDTKVAAAERPSQMMPPPGAGPMGAPPPGARPSGAPPPRRSPPPGAASQPGPTGAGVPPGAMGVPPGFQLPPGMEHQLPLPSKDNVLPNAPNPHAAGGHAPSGDNLALPKANDGENKLKLKK